MHAYLIHVLTKVTGHLSFTPNCHLIHFGKHEVLSCIDAMEAECEEVLTWVDPGPGEAASSGTETPGPWGEGIHLYGVPQPLKACLTASLMADSYSFALTEELSRVQKYLCEHSGWQLEQVSYQSKRSRLLAIDSHVMGWSLEWLLVFHISLIPSVHFSGQWHGELSLC